MANRRPKPGRDTSDAERSSRIGPITIAHRREAIQHQLDRLRSVLAQDMPGAERAIVLRRYKVVCQEAAQLGMAVD